MRTFRSAIIWTSILLIIGVGVLLLIASQLQKSDSDFQQSNLTNSPEESIELVSNVSDTNKSFEENGDHYFMDADQKAIKQFKIKTRDITLPQTYMEQNTYILRWIKSQDGDVDSAVEKFKQNLQWRKENRIEEVMEEDFANVIAQCPFEINGLDKKGNPIALLPFGSWQLNKVIIGGKLDHLYRMFYFMLENNTRIVQELSNHTGKLHKMVVIVDLAGFSYRVHACYNCIQLMTHMGLMYESYYPEFAEKAFLINVPRVAYTTFNLILPFLSKRTNDLVQMFGYDKEEWSAELLKYIDPDQLPSKYKNIPQQSTESTSWW